MDNQLTPEWFAARVGKITASNVGAILGHSKYRTAEDVLRSMVREYFGDEKEFLGNIATEWGNEHESAAIAALEVSIGEDIAESGLITHPELEWAAASPDGLYTACTEDGVYTAGTIEVKCPFSKKLFDLAEREEYYDQVQWQMFCAQVHESYFGVWTPEDFRFEPVSRQDSWILDNLPPITAFYEGYLKVIADEELSRPYREALVQDMGMDAEWQALCFERAEVKAKHEHYAALLSDVNDRIKAKAGGRKSEGSGILVYPIAGRTTVSWKKAIDAAGVDIDVTKYTKTGKPSWGIKESK